MGTHARITALVSVAMFAAGCGGGATPAPRLELSATPPSLAAGAPGVQVTATLFGATGPISWTLAGPGGLSSTTGTTIDYTPPATVSTSTAATLTAAGAGLTAQAVIWINPPPPPPFVSVTPDAPVLTAGDDPVLLSATMTGGSGILAWSLSGPGSISPAGGAAVHYAPPANVASTTTATVSASAPGLVTGQAVITVNPGPAGTITVSGLVLVTRSGLSPLVEAEAPRPAAGARVRVSGLATEATTDATGAFRIRGVTAPYDITAILTVPPVVRGTTYVGLSREDPTLLVGIWSTRPGGTITGRLSGEGPLAFPEAPVRTDWVTFLSPRAVARTDVLDHVSGDFTLGSMIWTSLPPEPLSATGDLYVLQNEWDGAGRPVFTGFGERTALTVAPSQPLAAQDVVLAPISSGIISGTVEAPAGARVEVDGSLRWPSRPMALQFQRGSVTGTAFEIATPDLPGTEVEVTLSSTLADGSTAQRLPRLPASAAGLAAVLREPPTLLSPAPNATGVDLATPFAWTGLDGAVHDVHFLLLSASLRTEIDVVTTAATAALPDLGPFGLGSATDPAFTSYWQVTALGPVSTVDAAAAAPATLWYATTGLRPFKVAGTPR